MLDKKILNKVIKAHYNQQKKHNDNKLLSKINNKSLTINDYQEIINNFLSNDQKDFDLLLKQDSNLKSNHGFLSAITKSIEGIYYFYQTCLLSDSQKISPFLTNSQLIGCLLNSLKNADPAVTIDLISQENFNSHQLCPLLINDLIHDKNGHILSEIFIYGKNKTQDRAIERLAMLKNIPEFADFLNGHYQLSTNSSKSTDFFLPRKENTFPAPGRNLFFAYLPEHKIATITEKLQLDINQADLTGLTPLYYFVNNFINNIRLNSTNLMPPREIEKNIKIINAYLKAGARINVFNHNQESLIKKINNFLQKEPALQSISSQSILELKSLIDQQIIQEKIKNPLKAINSKL